MSQLFGAVIITGAENIVILFAVHVRGVVVFTGACHGKDVRLQETGEEDNKEAKRRSDGAERETDSAESQLQICRKLVCVCLLLCVRLATTIIDSLACVSCLIILRT